DDRRAGRRLRADRAGQLRRPRFLPHRRREALGRRDHAGRGRASEPEAHRRARRDRGRRPVLRQRRVQLHDRSAPARRRWGGLSSERAQRANQCDSGPVSRAAAEGGAPVSTYVVTGSASGMGAATKQRLEADGHEVFGIDVRDATITADLGTRDGRENAIAAVYQYADGAIDGIVTFAGLGGTSTRPGSIVASVNY